VQISEPILFNGKSFSREGIHAYCTREIARKGQDLWKAAIYQFILDFLDERQPLVQKTSGTTGDPKSLPLCRDSMIRSAEMTLKYFNLRPGDTALLCLPVEYIAGKMMLVRALVGGLNLHTHEPAGNPLKRLDSEIDFAAMVPLQVHEALRQKESFRGIKKLIIGGGEINKELMESIQKLNSTLVYESFAMSETYSHFAIKQVNGPDAQKNFHVLHDVKISTDRRSCLCVEIPGITAGKIITNDIVDLISATEFKWLGRIDNVINSGGIKIIPEILENKIMDILEKPVLVIGIPDKKLGQKLVLVVEGTMHPGTFEDIIEKLAPSLHKHELPKEVRTVPEFPRNKAMKVDRLGVKMIINS